MQVGVLVLECTVFGSLVDLIIGDPIVWQGEKGDPEKLRREREELEMQRKKGAPP